MAAWAAGSSSLSDFGVAMVGTPAQRAYEADGDECALILSIQNLGKTPGDPRSMTTTACALTAQQASDAGAVLDQVSVSIGQVPAASSGSAVRSGVVLVPSVRGQQREPSHGVRQRRGPYKAAARSGQQAGIFIIPFMESAEAGIVLFPNGTAGSSFRRGGDGMLFPATPAYVGRRARSATAALPAASSSSAISLVSIESSFCPNTEDRNKQAVPASCMQVPTAAALTQTDGTLAAPGPIVYAIFDPLTIGEHLLRDASVSQRARATGVTLSHCGAEPHLSRSVDDMPNSDLRGSQYYLGAMTLATSAYNDSTAAPSMPAVSVLPSKVTVPWIDAGMAALGAQAGAFGVFAHDGWSASSSDVGKCGAPFASSGPMLDGMPLPILS